MFWMYSRHSLCGHLAYVDTSMLWRTVSYYVPNKIASLMWTPRNCGHIFSGSWVSTLERFYCISLHMITDMLSRFLFLTAEYLGTTAHQLHKWASTTVLQSSHVCSGTRGVQKRRHQLGVYWFRNGLAGDNWTHWKGNWWVNTIWNIDLRAFRKNGSHLSNPNKTFRCLFFYA